MKTLVRATRPRQWAIAALLGAALVGPGPANAQTPTVAPVKQRYVQGSWVNLRDSAQSQARIVALLTGFRSQDGTPIPVIGLPDTGSLR